MLLFGGIAFVIYHLYAMWIQIQRRDLRNPKGAISDLKSLKERMWLRSLEPHAPMISLRPVGPYGTWGLTAHLSKVPAGWVLMWGETAIPLFAYEVTCSELDPPGTVQISFEGQTFRFVAPE